MCLTLATHIKTDGNLKLNKEYYCKKGIQVDVSKDLYTHSSIADTRFVLAVQSCKGVGNAPHLISLFLAFFSFKSSLHVQHMKHGPDKS